MNHLSRTTSRTIDKTTKLLDGEKKRGESTGKEPACGRKVCIQLPRHIITYTISQLLRSGTCRRRLPQQWCCRGSVGSSESTGSHSRFSSYKLDHCKYVPAHIPSTETSAGAMYRPLFAKGHDGGVRISTQASTRYRIGACHTNSIVINKQWYRQAGNDGTAQSGICTIIKLWANLKMRIITLCYIPQ